MPIKALMRGPRLPQIGVLRKGAPKTGNAPGRELPYWRFVTRDPQLAADFKAVYGPQPTEVEAILAGKTLDEAFDYWREAYSTGSLLHRCDGETVVLQLQKDRKGYDRWPQGEGPACPGGCKQVGRLHVVLPALKRAGIVTVQTTSINDILSIGGTLAYCEQVVELNKILFRLARVEHEISTPQTNQQGNRIRVTKHLIEIQPHQSWVERQLSIDPAGDLAELPPMRALALDEADDEDDEGEDPPEVEQTESIADYAPDAIKRVALTPAVEPEGPDFGTTDADSSPWVARGMTPEQFEEAAATGSLTPDPPETTPSQPVAASAASPTTEPHRSSSGATPAGSPARRNGSASDPAAVRQRIKDVVGEALTINEYLKLDIPLVDPPPDEATPAALIAAGKKQAEYIVFALESAFDKHHLDVSKMPTLTPQSTPTDQRAYRVAFATAIGEAVGVDFTTVKRIVVE